MDIRTILAPVDRSTAARAAVREAAAVANKFDAALVLLHVAEPRSSGGYEGGDAPGEEEAYDLEELLILARKEAPAARSEAVIVRGDVAESIGRLCIERKADLIVMPTRGQGSYRRYLIGSNAAKVLHDARCPVLTAAHVEHPEDACYPYRRIACLLDLMDDGTKTLRYAQQLAAAFGATVGVIHLAPDFQVVEPDLQNEFARDLKSSVRLRLEQLLEQEGIDAQITVRTGAIEAALAPLLTEGRYDLLILNRGAFAGDDAARVLDAGAYAAIRCSPCPVLSV